MQEYDLAFELLLQGSAGLTIRELAGGALQKWLDIEQPKAQETLERENHRSRLHKIPDTTAPLAARSTVEREDLIVACLTPKD